MIALVKGRIIRGVSVSPSVNKYNSVVLPSVRRKSSCFRLPTTNSKIVERLSKTMRREKAASLFGVTL